MELPDVDDITHYMQAVTRLTDENNRMRKALEFYADPMCYFAIAMIGDSPTGPFYWDMDEMHDSEMPGPRRGAFARAALRNEDYEPPFDFADFKERHPELCEEE